MSSATKRPGASEGKTFVARIVQPGDVPALLRLARETDIGSIRADRQRIAHEVEICHMTLRGEIPWEQGMLFLVTDCYRAGERPRLVGQAKIRWAFDACWLRMPRLGQRAGKTVQHDVLVYHSERSGALEFAGNAVLESYQSQGIGGFQTKTRVLFLILFDLPGVSKIFADFLTRDVSGRYPFYEEVVRSLLENREYDVVDAHRHEARGRRVAFFESCLGPSGTQPACEILLDSLPAEIGDSFGAIRPKSLPAAKALQKYGFAPCNKYDLLDGGQYMETSIASLRATARTKTLLVEKVSPAESEDGQRAVFAPNRPMPGFVAAWGNANVAANRLLIDPDLCEMLHLKAGEPVTVLL